MNPWLIGAGTMALEYAKVLQDLDHSFTVIGRSEKTAKVFAAKTGVTPTTGGLSRALRENPSPENAIVTVGIEELADTAIALIKNGTQNILLEKPGGVNIEEIRKVNGVAAQNQAKVLVGYNRRFFKSTLKAEELIAKDGGITSVQFEFTEWASKIEKLSLPSSVKKQWLLCNSTHVMDLVFYLCGKPVDWKHWHKGSLSWHPTASRFCGAGMTDQGVAFSYMADWGAPGRWGIKVLTPKRRLIFRPMEQLQVMELDSLKMEALPLEDDLDKRFKPGIHRQVGAFLNNETSRFCNISQQVANAEIYSLMGGYCM